LEVLILVATLGIAGCAESADERRLSIYDLSDDPTAENRRRIREMLTDADPDIRATALNSLVGLRPDDAEGLALAALGDGHGFVRATAAKLVGDLGNREDAEILVEHLLGDPDPWVRQRAAEALEQLGGDVAASGLARALADPMDQVRLASVKAIRKVDPGAAKPVLARLLLEDAAWEIRVQAAGALGLAGDADFRQVLEAALDDESDYVRSAAARALESLDKAQVGSEQVP